MSIFFKIGNIDISSEKLFLISGPCVLEEDENVSFEIAKKLKEISIKLNIPFIFKASYLKANRTSKDSYRGPGIKNGLKQLARIKEELGLPVLSDIHSEQEVEEAAEILDVLQIPAFLCRQTFLIEKAARTGKVINLKKGQFLAPQDMRYAAEKVTALSNNKVLITERGCSFGYNNLIVDMRAFPIMSQFGFPIIFDATHSVQLPGGGVGESSGQREMVPALLRAAVAAGCHGLFLESHIKIDSSPSDRQTIFPVENLETLLKEAILIKLALVKKD